MKRVYISSTSEDLQDYRQAVADVLRSCGYDVDAMEKYAARDDRPKAACVADVSGCDIYVGIFAWKYGHVPTDDNSEKRSITELEYLAAESAQIPRLIFLLSDDAPWPTAKRDAEQGEDGGKRIRDLRNRLKAGSWTAFFKTPDDLAKQVLISVFQLEATKRVDSLAEIEEIKLAPQLGPSYFANIEKIEQLVSVEFVAIRLGPTPWWNTRLHLVSALASDFTEIREFVLLDAENQLLVVTPPAELRRALTKIQPKLELAYLQSRMSPPGPIGGSDVTAIISNYEMSVMTVFGAPETMVKQVITPINLRELGIKTQAEVVNHSAGERRPLLSADILRSSSPYVVLMQDHNLEGVVDRTQLASRIAKSLLE
jgi:hypothetical protein